MRAFRLLSLAVLCVLPTAAQQRPFDVPDGVQVAKDLVYASTPEKELTLDVYRAKSAGKQKLPLIVWIHGGGWRNGSKENPRLAIGLVERGYVVASINYRLSGEAIFPAQIHDCKAAVRWLRAHADDYGIAAGRVGVWGSSAGGHLVALLGTSGGVEDLEGNVGPASLGMSSRVQAVADYFGPTDFLQMDPHSISDRLIHNAPDSPESKLVGGPITKHPDRVARANPITYVTPDDPPFLIVHGDKDPLVPHHQSELLLAALQEAGVRAELHTVKGGEHGRGGEFGTPELFERVAAFFDGILKH